MRVTKTTREMIIWNKKSESVFEREIKRTLHTISGRESANERKRENERKRKEKEKEKERERCGEMNIRKESESGKEA